MSLWGEGIVDAEEAPRTDAVEQTSEAEGQRSVDELINDLGSDDAATRAAAARILGEGRDVRGVSAMVQLLRRDPNPEVRGWLIRALHQIGTQDARSAVIEVGRADIDQRVRALAAELYPSELPSESPFIQEDDQQPTQSLVAPSPRPGQLGEPRSPDQPRGRDLTRRLLVAGWSLAGSAYGTSLIVGAVMVALDETQLGAYQFIPLLGPIISAMYASHDEELISFTGFSVNTVVSQFAGFIMGIVGASRRRARRERAARGPRAPSFTVVPAVSRDRTTLSMIGAF